MRYLGEDDLTQVMGIGSLGEVRAGPDGNLYQWVQGVDGLGNLVGFWSKWKRRAQKFARRALPLVKRIAPFIPGGAAAMTAATPFLRQAGITGYGGLGALYQAPDGSLYQVQGFAEDDELRGLGADDLTQVMGIGSLGEVRAGPDGNLYQWVQGVDGLGNLVGFWSKWKRRAQKFARRALPLVKRIAPFIPGGAAAMTAATPFLRQAGVTGYGGLGALYQAPDGSLYQVQGFAEDDELRGYGEDDELRGFAEDDELRGFAEDDELRGFAEDDELRGFAEDDELRGYGEDDELRGFAEDDELRGFAEDDELRGFAEDDELRGMDGYVLQDGMSGLEKFVPDEPARTRWFVPPTQPPEVWRPLW